MKNAATGLPGKPNTAFPSISPIMVVAGFHSQTVDEHLAQVNQDPGHIVFFSPQRAARDQQDIHIRNQLFTGFFQGL